MEGEEEKKNNVSGNGFGSLTQTHSVRIYIYIYIFVVGYVEIGVFTQLASLVKEFLVELGIFWNHFPTKNTSPPLPLHL